MKLFNEKGELHPFYEGQDIEDVHTKARILLEYLTPRRNPFGPTEASLQAMSDSADLSPNCVKYAGALLLYYGFLSEVSPSDDGRILFSFPDDMLSILADYWKSPLCV